MLQNVPHGTRIRQTKPVAQGLSFFRCPCVVHLQLVKPGINRGFASRRRAKYPALATPGYKTFFNNGLNLML